MTAYRIIFVFIATIFFIGLVVPYDDPNLVGGANDANNSRESHSTIRRSSTLVQTDGFLRI